MKESELERRFCRLVEQAGGKAYKFVSPGNSGVPDRIVVLPGGRIGFVELNIDARVFNKGSFSIGDQYVLFSFRKTSSALTNRWMIVFNHLANLT